MSDTENLLSNEELEAIQSMVAEGGFSGEVYGYQPDAQPISISKNEESLGATSTAISQINERFHRLFRTAMLTELDYNPRLSVATPKLENYSEYIHSIESPTSVNVAEFLPLKGEALFILHPQVVFSCLDNWYGGELRPLNVSEDRSFTANENAVIESICNLLFRSLEESWSPYVNVEIKLLNRDINPLFANIAADEQSVVVNRFDLRLPDEGIEAYIDIVYTYESLNLQRDLLNQRVQTQDADSTWSKRLEKTLGEVPFQLVVNGGVLNLSVEELQHLRVGDILDFDPPPKSEVQVSNFPLYSAETGMAGGKVAVKIEQAILEGEQ